VIAAPPAEWPSRITGRGLAAAIAAPMRAA
jgi:hypothetical protein